MLFPQYRKQPSWLYSDENSTSFIYPFLPWTVIYLVVIKCSIVQDRFATQASRRPIV